MATARSAEMTQPRYLRKQCDLDEEHRRLPREAIPTNTPEGRGGSRTGNTLANLRERIRRIERTTTMLHGVVPFGIAAIDRALPGGGLARGALHEILGAEGDEEDGAVAASFAAYILGRFTGTAGGIVLWCLPRPDLYGPGLAAHGLDPGQIVLVRAPRDAEILWAMEEGLRAPGILAVVGEVGTLPVLARRRLQLAAEHSGITAIVLRRWRNGEQAARERALPNAAVTRWRVAALPSRPIHGQPGVGRPRWRIELLRCRGAEPAKWEMEVPDATDHVSFSAALADRAIAPVAVQKLRRAG
jgi:protein ImuA